MPIAISPSLKTTPLAEVQPGSLVRVGATLGFCAESPQGQEHFIVAYDPSGTFGIRPVGGVDGSILEAI